MQSWPLNKLFPVERMPRPLDEASAAPWHRRVKRLKPWIAWI